MAAASGTASPDAPSGPSEALSKAIGNAPDAAMQGLARARERVMDMAQTAVRKATTSMGQAGDAIREGIPDVAGQASATIVPDALAYLPEVWP